MAVSSASLPILHFEDAAGNPLVGGKLYTYQAGTSTPQSTYTDSTGSTPNTNPVILNARGEAACWMTTGLSYKFVLKDSAENLIWSADNVLNVDALTVALASLSASGGSALVGFLQSGTGAVARTVQAKARDTYSVQDFGAVGDGTTNDAAAIQAAINAVNTKGGGTLDLPNERYNIGTTSVTVYQNVILRGGAGRYGGTTTRGTTLIYTGTGAAITGQGLLDFQIHNIDVDCTGATGTTVRGFYGNGIWKSSFKNFSVRGVTPAKGYSVLLDTYSGGGPFGAQHNYFEECEFPDGIVRFLGVSGTEGVTTTVMNTIRGFMYQVVSSQVTFINATAEQFPDGSFGYDFSGAGCVCTMLGCDIENSSALAKGINITAPASVREFGTVWNGFNGTGANRVTGTMDTLRSYGGAFEFVYPFAVGVPVLSSLMRDSNANYVSEYIYPDVTTGGAQTAHRVWHRTIGGVDYVDHEWKEHAFASKTLTTTATTAQLVFTVPVPSGEGLKVSLHAHGTQVADQPFSNSRGCNVINNGGTLTIVSDTQVTVGSTGAITFTASGANLLVNWTPTTANSTTAKFNMEIRGPWTSYT